VLDRRIREAARAGRLDAAFIAVLDANINAAQEAAAAGGEKETERLQVGARTLRCAQRLTLGSDREPTNEFIGMGARIDAYYEH
jgi:hypothetical protein